MTTVGIMFFLSKCHSDLTPIFPMDDDTIQKFRQTTEYVFKKLTLIKLENQKLTELRDWLLPPC